jgi:DnaJ-class molecular chaperone
VALLRDPYELLDLDRTADIRQVKRAYRRLAKRYHPDAARDDGRAFVALRTAYETLIDPDRRIEWDRQHPSSGYRSRGTGATTGRGARKPRANGHAESGGLDDSATPNGNGRARRARDQRGRFVRAEAAPWWEEIRGVRSVGVDLPGSRGDPHLGPSSSGAAWSSAARAYFRRLTRQDSAAGRSAPRGQPGRAR